MWKINRFIRFLNELWEFFCAGSNAALEVGDCHTRWFVCHHYVLFQPSSGQLELMLLQSWLKSSDKSLPPVCLERTLAAITGFCRPFLWTEVKADNLKCQDGTLFLSGHRITGGHLLSWVGGFAPPSLPHDCSSSSGVQSRCPSYLPGDAVGGCCAVTNRPPGRLLICSLQSEMGASRGLSFQVRSSRESDSRWLNHQQAAEGQRHPPEHWAEREAKHSRSGERKHICRHVSRGQQKPSLLPKALIGSRCKCLVPGWQTSFSWYARRGSCMAEWERDRIWSQKTQTQDLTHTWPLNSYVRGQQTAAHRPYPATTCSYK